MTTRPIHTYSNGLPYRAPRSSVFPSPFIGRSIAAPCIAVDGPGLGWADLWAAAQQKLRQARFATSTLLLYRRILRAFRTFAANHPHPGLRTDLPCNVRKALVEDFIRHINRDRASWSWISTNIAVLRTVFDKLAGFTVTARLQTPRRPHHLPEIINSTEAAALIQATATIRDRLIIGLMYGCGLKVGEVCAIRWQDVDTVRQMLTIRYNRETPASAQALWRGRQVREVPIPDALRDVLNLGREKCAPADHLFPGAKPGKALTARLIERMVRRMAQAAGIGKIVTCMTLRHSYAVDCLRHGMTEVQLQRNLGHKSIETTLLYRRCSLPADAKSPLDSHTNSQVPPPTPPNAQTPTHSPLLPKLDIRDLTLPFPELTSGAREFVSMLKTRIKGRFLALRSFLSNTS